MITAYIDGGARGNPGPAGYGAHIVNDSGEVVAELHGALGIATNNVAEYNGLIAALQWAASHAVDAIHVKADSLLLVEQMRGNYRVKNAGLIPLYNVRAISWLALDVTFTSARARTKKDRLSPWTRAADAIHRADSGSWFCLNLTQGPRSWRCSRALFRRLRRLKPSHAPMLTRRRMFRWSRPADAIRRPRSRRSGSGRGEPPIDVAGNDARQERLRSSRPPHSREGLCSARRNDNHSDRCRTRPQEYRAPQRPARVPRQLANGGAAALRVGDQDGNAVGDAH
jgi:ribonuclease HI